MNADDPVRVRLDLDRRERVRPMGFRPNQDYPDLLDLVIEISSNVSNSIMLNVHEVAELRRLTTAELLGGSDRDVLIEAIFQHAALSRAAISDVLHALDDVLADAERRPR